MGAGKQTLHGAKMFEGGTGRESVDVLTDVDHYSLRTCDGSVVIPCWSEAFALARSVGRLTHVALLGHSTQSLTSLCENRPNRVFGDAKLLGDLAVVQILQMVEADNLSLAVG